MNCKPVFFPPWQLDGTHSPTAIQTEQPCCERSSPPVSDVSDSTPDPVGQILQSRFLRAWQKMLDEGVDWFAVQGERDRAKLGGRE
jgi:hypothetical protein